MIVFQNLKGPRQYELGLDILSIKETPTSLTFLGKVVLPGIIIRPKLTKTDFVEAQGGLNFG